ncbi:membrane-spanning 4-domains subfamily A member 4A-like isoform X1 [Eleutherodactylus coqui]|uniref:membrane-spanning 4-domains subfamily A member 4A-like isoform X1 n=1 Tax=Eleutherodactylus coqui TaxID=57060 RepID=UPI00346378BC
MSTNASIPSVVILQHGNPQNNQPMENHEEQKIAELPKPLVKFFQGEPEVLGVTQLINGINNIFFGIVLAVACKQLVCYPADILVVTGAPFWSGIMFIIAGSLSIAASCKPSVGKVTATLALNILSCIAAVITVAILVSYFMSTLWWYYHHNDNHCVYYKGSQTCEGEFSPQVVEIGIGSTILLFTTLEFCIALSTSIFGCKTVCRTSYNDTTVVIYHTTTVQESKPALSADGEVKIH